MGCKVIGRFFCVYVIAKERGFHIGNVEVSCEHCLSKVLSGFGGTVIYKKRFKHLPPFEKISPALEKVGKEWMDGTHSLCEEDTRRQTDRSLKTP